MFTYLLTGTTQLHPGNSPQHVVQLLAGFPSLDAVEGIGIDGSTMSVLVYLYTGLQKWNLHH